MGSALLDGGRSAYINEFRFEAAKCSDMDWVELQVGLFADSQEWDFQSAKRSGMCSAVPQLD